jgi:hypothetical protein
VYPSSSARTFWLNSVKSEAMYVMMGDMYEIKEGSKPSLKSVEDTGVPPSAYEIYEAHRRLAEAVEDVAGQAEGNRNNVLMIQMSKMWPLVLGGCLDEEKMVSAMLAAAEKCGIDEGEFEYVSSRRREAADAARPVPPFDVVGEEEPRGPGGVKKEKTCSWEGCGLAPEDGKSLCTAHLRTRETDKARAAVEDDVLEYDPRHIWADLHLARRIADEYLEKNVRAWGKKGWAFWGGRKWDLADVSWRLPRNSVTG